MVDGWVSVNKANLQVPDSVFNPGIQEGGSSRHSSWFCRDGPGTTLKQLD